MEMAAETSLFFCELVRDDYAHQTEACANGVLIYLTNRCANPASNCGGNIAARNDACTAICKFNHHGLHLLLALFVRLLVLVIRFKSCVEKSSNIFLILVKPQGYSPEYQGVSA
jgi:hypothetical protein